LYRICGLFIHRLSVFEDVESGPGVPLSGLASSSVENLRHMTCGTTRGGSSKTVALKKYLMLRRCCKNGTGAPLAWPCFFLSGDLASYGLQFEKYRETVLAAAPVALATAYSEMVQAFSRRSAFLALRASSVETLRQMTCCSKKIERPCLQHPLRVFWRRRCGLPRRFPCLVLRSSLSGEICATRLVEFEKYREGCSDVSKRC
jgi:hypothetical protein